MKMIDDADWLNVARLLKDEPLTQSEKRWHQGFCRRFDTYLEASKQSHSIIIGMLVSKYYYNRYNEITMKYSSTREYRRWADQVMCMDMGA